MSSQTIQVPKKSNNDHEDLAHMYITKNFKNGFYYSHCGLRRIKNIDGTPNWEKPLCVVCLELENVRKSKRG